MTVETTVVRMADMMVPWRAAEKAVLKVEMKVATTAAS